MRPRIRIAILILTAILAAGPALVVRGQESSGEALSIRLSRKFGYSLGAQMQGTFTIRVDSPQDLTRVEFLLDWQVIGEDREAPFSLGFNTREHPEGVHSFSALGYKANGEQVRSEGVSRQFVATSSVTIAVIAIVALAIAFRVGSYFLARRSGGQRAAYGYLGGTVCRHCGRPFGIHWWSIRLGIGRYDRCPHCNKWNMVQRASTEALLEAKEHQWEMDGRPGMASASSEEEAQRRRIEESRYDQG